MILDFVLVFDVVFFLDIDIGVVIFLVWCCVFGMDVVSLKDNFFDFGGYSFLVV